MLKIAIVMCLLATVAVGKEADPYAKFAEGSKSRESMKIFGNVAAVFTPVNENLELDFTNLEKMAKRLSDWGVPNVMVGGTTGESVSFSTDERKQAVTEWLKIAPKYKLNVYVHVGMNAVWEAKDYAAWCAKQPGVKGLFAMPPVYFKPNTPEILAHTMAVVASGAPSLPFWYYHFPANTLVDVNIYEFVKYVDEAHLIPNLMGIKFTFEKLNNFNAVGTMKNGKYNMLMGRDEMLTSALATGVCDASVSSTVNFMSFNIPIRNLFTTWKQADMVRAMGLQNQTVQVIETWGEGTSVGFNVQKSILKMTGIDFGPLRWPQKNMSPQQEKELGSKLAHFGINITAEYIDYELLDDLKSGKVPNFLDMNLLK